MRLLFSRVRSLFRPEDEILSRETRSQIQLYRLLTFLGIVLIPLFGVLYHVSNPDAVDPTWARLGIAELLAALLAASYVLEQVRRKYGAWLQGTLYLIIYNNGVGCGADHFKSFRR